MDRYDSVTSFINKASHCIVEKVKESKVENSILKKELEEVKSEFESKSCELDNLQEQYCKVKLKLKSDSVRNLNKKLKRRDFRIEKLETEVREMKDKDREIKEKQEEFDALSNKCEQQSINYSKLNDTVRKLQFKLSYMKRKNNSQDRKTESLQQEMDDLEHKCKLLEREKNELNQFIDLLNDDEIVTFENGKYCDELRETIMELLSLNVSMNKVNEVIKTVINKLTNKSIGRLPSNAVKSRLLVEARHLAYLHVAEEMLKEGVDGYTGNCLHGDGTSKYHRHYQNFQITLSSGQTLSLGLREIGGGDTAAVMSSFMETINDLSDTFNSDTENRESMVEKLVCSIKSTKSDRGPINPCFHKQLQILREGFLPRVIEQWENFDESVRNSLSDMCNFFCKMHLLPNMATESNKILKVFEDVALLTVENKCSFKTDESGTARLHVVRTAAKAFHPTGSDEAGVASYFDSFLKGKNEKLKIVSFRGSRFNILFYDADATYYHREHIIYFLKSWPNPNNLLKAVSEDSISSWFKGIRYCR